MDFVDTDGNIVVPKAVRPVIDLQETALGSKKGAGKQYRYAVSAFDKVGNESKRSVEIDVTAP